MSANTLARSLHDVGLAARFGRTPVNAAAIAAHIAGSIGMLGSNLGRFSAQKPASTPKEVAAAQRQLRGLQWAVPTLTGALVVIIARAHATPPRPSLLGHRDGRRPN